MRKKEGIESIKKGKFDKKRLYNYFTSTLIIASSLFGTYSLIALGNLHIKEALYKVLNDRIYENLIIVLDIITITISTCLCINIILWVSDKCLFSVDVHFRRVFVESNVTRIVIGILCFIAMYSIAMNILAAIS